MMTFNRICLEDYEMEDGDRQFTLKRGQEYTTSPTREADETVMVFSRYWVRVPVRIFAGAKRFT